MIHLLIVLCASCGGGLFLFAAIGKLCAFPAMKSWVRWQISIRAEGAFVVGMIGFDLLAATVTVTAGLYDGGHLVTAIGFLALSLFRFRFRGRVQSCPCFGSSARPTFGGINAALCLLAFGHVVAYLFSTQSLHPDTFGIVAASVIGTVAVGYLTFVPTNERTLRAGTLSSDEMQALRRALPQRSAAMARKVLILNGHPQCSSCMELAAAWTSVVQIFPREWSALFDLAIPVSASRSFVDGVELISLGPDLRRSLGIGAGPAITKIEEAGNYTTYEGVNACQKVITELVAAARTWNGSRREAAANG